MPTPLPRLDLPTETPPGRHRAAGFTLVEVIVALAIMVMIATTVTQSTVAFLDRTRVDRGYVTLAALDTAITRFRANVGQYPRSLTQLSTAITGTSLNSCGTAFGTTRAALWAGPYISRIIPATGLPVFIGRAQNNTVRTPTTGGVNPILAIRVDSVRQEDIESINETVDGDGTGVAGSTGGQVRWGTITSGVATLDYVRSLPANAC